jgi:hypothetical protein
MVEQCVPDSADGRTGTCAVVPADYDEVGVGLETGAAVAVAGMVIALLALPSRAGGSR